MPVDLLMPKLGLTMSEGVLLEWKAAPGERVAKGQIIFVVETGSVMLQIAYFRLTGGKRIFRMSPLHHHFELGGWDEEKITLRFWIVAVLAGLLGVTLFLASVHQL